MYKPNKKHLQPPLFSQVNELPEKHRQRLEHSWAGVFYREFFCRLDESPFGKLYSDLPSRPNIPVNVLVGLDALKAGFGWSDEELYDHFLFDIQVRYALGYRDLQAGEFELRTLYNFRRRLSHYNQAHGVNLLGQAFASITDQQIQALKVNTHLQRMDSTQIASNIQDLSRLQLLIEALQRLHRLLSAEDQRRYQELLAPFVKNASGPYVYRVKGKEATQAHLQQAGQVLYDLLTAMRSAYGQDPVFQTCERFFQDNFELQDSQAQPKANEQISAACLQSLIDQEATFRRKGEAEYKGYVANVSETCDPDNPVQLITHIQIAPNTTEDSQLLLTAMPILKERTDLERLYTDGGYASPETDPQLNQQQVEHVQTAIKGRAPDADKLGLGDYELIFDPQGFPTQITCPQGQTAGVRWGQKKQALVADFEPRECEACPFHQDKRCRVKLGKRDGRYHLDFNLHEAHVARRRRLKMEQARSGRNPRAAIEATMRVIKHPFPGGKLPVRGLFRVTCLLMASAAMVNVRSIFRSWQTQKVGQPAGQEAQKSASDTGEVSFALLLERFWGIVQPFLAPRKSCFSC